jgi:hypothetical protein
MARDNESLRPPITKGPPITCFALICRFPCFAAKKS